MTTPKIDMIKAVLGFAGVPDADLVSRCNAVHDGMTNNPAYPTPPIDMPGFKTAIDAYAAAVAGALDGGKAAIATRNKRRGDMILMLRQLGHYVEIACKGGHEDLRIEWFRGRVHRHGPGSSRLVQPRSPRSVKAPLASLW